MCTGFVDRLSARPETFCRLSLLTLGSEACRVCPHTPMDMWEHPLACLATAGMEQQPNRWWIHVLGALEGQHPVLLGMGCGAAMSAFLLSDLLAQGSRTVRWHLHVFILFACTTHLLHCGKWKQPPFSYSADVCHFVVFGYCKAHLMWIRWKVCRVVFWLLSKENLGSAGIQLSESWPSWVFLELANELPVQPWGVCSSQGCRVFRLPATWAIPAWRVTGEDKIIHAQSMESDCREEKWIDITAISLNQRVPSRQKDKDCKPGCIWLCLGGHSLSSGLTKCVLYRFM